jgi:hypothetical protein
MTVKNLLLTQASLLIIAAAICIYTMLQAAAWSPDIGMVVFIIWATSPYIAFFAASRLLSKLVPSSNLTIPATVIAGIMLAFTAYAYIGTAGDRSSTYALIFLFVPLYLYLGSFFLLMAAFAVSLVIRGRDRAG